MVGPLRAGEFGLEKYENNYQPLQNLYPIMYWIALRLSDTKIIQRITINPNWCVTHCWKDYSEKKKWSTNFPNSNHENTMLVMKNN